MSAPTVRVTIGRIRQSDGKNPRVEWNLHVPGETKPRKKTAAHPDHDILDVFRVRLVTALAAGLPFDRETGLPPGVERPTTRSVVDDSAGRPLYLDVAVRLHKRWDNKGPNRQRKGHTVKGWVNEALSVTVALLRADAPDLTPAEHASARDWLRQQFIPQAARDRIARADAEKLAAARAAGPKDKQQRYRWKRADARAATRAAAQAETDAQWQAFFDRYGLRWFEVDKAAVLRALDALTRRVDGAPAAPQTETKHAIALNELLNWAVRNSKIGHNPMDVLEKDERPSTTTKVTPVDRRRVPGMDRVLDILDTCRSFGEAGDTIALRVLVFLAVLALAGLRRSEARALRVKDLRLPATGWGWLFFNTRTTTPGRAFTADGSPDEHGSLKWRNPDHNREVPIPPLLVALLRQHIRRLGLRGNDYLVCDEHGKQLATSDIDRVWHQVRAAVFTDPDEEELRTLELNELRHARVSLQIAAGLPDLKVALWHGHSVQVLHSTYESIIAAGTTGYLDEIQRHYDQLIPPGVPTAVALPVSPQPQITEQVLVELVSAVAGRLGDDIADRLLAAAHGSEAPAATLPSADPTYGRTLGRQLRALPTPDREVG